MSDVLYLLSQYSPVIPSGHRQMREPFSTIQEPPFVQGLLSQRDGVVVPGSVGTIVSTELR